MHLLFCYSFGIEPETQAIQSERGANLGVSYHKQTPRKPLSRCVARNAAPKAALIVGYSLHLLSVITTPSPLNHSVGRVLQSVFLMCLVNYLHL